MADELPPEWRAVIEEDPPHDEPADIRRDFDDRILVEQPAPNFPPLASRDELLVSAWLEKQLPPRDYLMGELLCTTSRWLLIGATGVGKTLFALSFAAAMAAGADFVGWQGKRRCRVMYLDGELPAETFKERIEIVARLYGADIELFGYNRDDLGDAEMPPLNTPDGQLWLWREIATVNPDVIVFDAIMSLVVGTMTEEESWDPIKPLVRRLTSRRIAQIWLHHTGHDTSKGYGTKTREWELDTVGILTNASGDESEDVGGEAATKIQLEFTKKRLCTPANFKQFVTKILTCSEDGFTFEDGKKRPPGKARDVVLSRAYVDAYLRLAADCEKSPGFDGAPVRKVSTDAIRDELKVRGFLEKDDRGQVTGKARKDLHKVKQSLLARGDFVEKDDFVWKK